MMENYYICEYCLAEWISRGEKVNYSKEYVDESIEEESTCAFCEESGFDVLFKIY